jgi:hypothetical protein
LEQVLQPKGVNGLLDVFIAGFLNSVVLLPVKDAFEISVG